jgi:hypothetical protein
MDRNARFGRLGLVIIAAILATVVFGWAGPLFTGLVFGLLDGRERAPREVALGAGLAWAVILLFTVLSAGGATAGVIGASLGVPVIVLPLVSVVFAAASGWSAAALAIALRHAVAGRRSSPGLPDAAPR